MASRRTYQCAGVVIMLAGLVGKFGAVLSCIPVPVLGAVTLSGFGMIISLGLSYLRHVDLCSSRNLVVLAISFSAGMAIPAWMNNNAGVINTGNYNNNNNYYYYCCCYYLLHTRHASFWH